MVDILDSKTFQTFAERMESLILAQARELQQLRLQIQFKSEWLTLEEFAEQSRQSPAQVRVRIASGDVKFNQDRKGGHYLIHISSLPKPNNDVSQVG